MAERLKGIGTHITRYGLVIVLLWIGGMKFTAYEAEGILQIAKCPPLALPSHQQLTIPQPL